MTEELINVPQDYASDEDPDFVPDTDEQEDSETLEEDDDEDNTEYENEDDEEDGNKVAKTSDVTEAKAKVTSSLEVAPSKEAGVVSGERNDSNKTQPKGSEPSEAVQKRVEKIPVKMSSVPQKTENVPAKEPAKTVVVNSEEKVSSKPQTTKVSELGQGVKNLVEKMKVKGPAPQKTENVSLKSALRKQAEQVMLVEGK